MKGDRGKGDRPLVGILAGMGPDSTAPFLEMVLAECRAQYGAAADDEFPPMSILSWPTPYFPDRLLDHDALRSSIHRGLDLLMTHSPAVIAMPCNTAHLYWESFRERVGFRLLNMVGGGVGALPSDAKRVLLLATRQTRDSGIYQAALAERGVLAVTQESLQRAIDDVLVALKEDPEKGRQAWREVPPLLGELSYDGVLLACSDLTPFVPVGRDPSEKDIPTIDTTRVLARDLVRSWRRLAGVKGPSRAW